MTEESIEPATEREEDAMSPRARRAWKIAAAVAVVLAFVAMGVLASLLVGAGSSTPAKDVMACVDTHDFTNGKKAVCPPKGAPYVDGLIQDATETGFDLVTIDGTKKTYAVRPADRPYIDVQHAQTHASLGQPIRIYTKRVDGQEVIIYMVDSPLKF